MTTTKRKGQKTPNEVYAVNLRALRRSAGFTQTYLADLAGVTPAMLSQIETMRRPISIRMLCLFADELGVSMDLVVNRVPPRGPCTGYEVEDFLPQEGAPSARVSRRLVSDHDILMATRALEADPPPPSNPFTLDDLSDAALEGLSHG